MPIQIRCPSCKQAATVPDTAAGKQIRCQCGSTFSVETPIPLEDIAIEQKASPTSAPTDSQQAPEQKPQGDSKKAILIVGVVFIIILLWVLKQFLGVGLFSGEAMPYLLGIGAFFVFVIAFIALRSRCPNCGKMFASKTLETRHGAPHIEVRTDAQVRQKHVNVTPYVEILFCSNCQQQYSRTGSSESSN